MDVVSAGSLMRFATVTTSYDQSFAHPIELAVEVWRRACAAWSFRYLVIELAPQFASKHVANIIALVKGGYFSKSSILRSQDNYVVQWGDPKASESSRAGARPSIATQPRILRPSLDT